MGASQRNKGKRGEQELARILRSYGYDAHRGVQYCGFTGEPDVVGLDGFHIECKRVETLNLYKAMEQSKRDARDGEIPTVMHRKNNHEWLATLRLKDFLELLQKEV